MPGIEDLEFSGMGRSGKPWLGFYAACALLAAVGGLSWGAFIYWRNTEPEKCELRGSAISPAGALSVYECPGGATLLVPMTPAERLVPLPRTE